MTTKYHDNKHGVQFSVVIPMRLPESRNKKSIVKEYAA